MAGLAGCFSCRVPLSVRVGAALCSGPRAPLSERSIPALLSAVLVDLSMETVIGQFYLAVLVAALVSAHSSDARGGADAGAGDRARESPRPEDLSPWYPQTPDRIGRSEVSDKLTEKS